MQPESSTGLVQVRENRARNVAAGDKETLAPGLAVGPQPYACRSAAVYHCNGAVQQVAPPFCPILGPQNRPQIVCSIASMRGPLANVSVGLAGA